jgi:hypothetical protein
MELAQSHVEWLPHGEEFWTTIIFSGSTVLRGIRNIYVDIYLIYILQKFYFLHHSLYTSELKKLVKYISLWKY